MERKKIGIGCENYKKFMDNDMYYVDKTLLIRDIFQSGATVSLFTRPRRFGKTLALSMLQTFFEKEIDKDGKPVDNRRYFEGKKICGCGEKILSKMGQFPVIRLSLKSADQTDFEDSFFMLRDAVIREFRRHEYLKDSKILDEDQIKNFRQFMEGVTLWNEKERGFCSDSVLERAFKREVRNYSTALLVLSQYLAVHHGSKVIVLLDEYDVPLENAYHKGFYDQMVGFIRSFFESVLKTNDALEFAVITGCLRISRESIFTGLNHLKVNSIWGSDYGEYFGFTQEETESMLAAYSLSNQVEQVRQWYDGYLFGEKEVYNPWSVTMYVDEHKEHPGWPAKNYWANTSSNSIIRELVEQADASVRQELDTLIQGGTIEKPIHEDITYEDIHASQENLWNFLFFTGYLRKVSERMDGEVILLLMRIPNIEVRSIYQFHIRSWFNQLLKNTDRRDIYKALQQKDMEKVGRLLTGLLQKSISTFDHAESFYHGFFLSLMLDFPEYTVMSNREAGDGRPDIVMYPDNILADPVYLFELKVRRKYSEIKNGLGEAYSQIAEKRYEEGILEEGFVSVISIGVCFCKKTCILGLYDKDQYRLQNSQ